jgi:hypothetical protein
MDKASKPQPGRNTKNFPNTSHARAFISKAAVIHHQPVFVAEFFVEVGLGPAQEPEPSFPHLSP